jgi:hypothetical protein
MEGDREFQRKIFCLNSGIEGPRGIEMINSQYFPLGKRKIGRKLVFATLFLGIVFVIFRWATF